MKPKKQCKLVLLKRRPLEENLFNDVAEEYCAGFEKPWVGFQSNAMLFNKSDLKRDVMDNPDALTRLSIKVDDLIIPTKFEMVELIEKKSFGFLIRRKFKDTYEYLKGDEAIVGSSLDSQYWTIGPRLADIYNAESKDKLLGELKQYYPDEQFSYQELFCE